MTKSFIRSALMKLDKDYLPLEHFQDLPYFEETLINDGITIINLPSYRGIYMQCFMKAGTSVTEHYHNSFEYLYVKEGEIIINNNRAVKKGQRIVFNPYEVHRVKCTEEAEIYIQLIKDDKYSKNTN